MTACGTDGVGDSTRVFVQSLCRWLLIMCMLLPSTVDARYFLSWKQKGELLLTGCVTDTSDNRFDVRIIPGYLSQLGFSKNQWVDGWRTEYNGSIMFSKGLLRIPVSFKYLGDYFSKKPWHGIADGFSETGEGEKYLFVDYMGRGVGNTWKEYWSYADDAFKRQSFGWWFAYPWAICKGSINTSLRYVTGSVGVAAVAAYGVALRPAFELSLPIFKTGIEATKQSAIATAGVAKASYGLALNQLLLGTATPVSGYIWTTAIGTPMALLGRAPTPQSADNWWVVLIGPENSPGLYSEGSHKNTIANSDTTSPMLDTALIDRLMSVQVGIAKNQRKWHSFQTEYDSAIDSLSEQISRIRVRYRHVADSMRNICIETGDSAIPVIPDSLRWSSSRRTELNSVLQEYIFSSPGYDSLTSVEKEKAITAIMDMLTTYELPQTNKGKRQFSKDPNKILQDELEQIFHGQ
jgi:hypothetical protein